MWTDLAELIALAAVVVGVFFMFVASLGVLRLADFYLRIHAPTKAATLGLFFLFSAIALNVQDKEVVTKAILALLFIAATAPVGAHLLCRAAYRSGIPPAAPVDLDEYAPVVRHRELDPTHQEHQPADDLEPGEGEPQASES